MLKIRLLIQELNGENHDFIVLHFMHDNLRITKILGGNMVEVDTHINEEVGEHFNYLNNFIEERGVLRDSGIIEVDDVTREFLKTWRNL